jgi:hypothetical protein
MRSTQNNYWFTEREPYNGINSLIAWELSVRSYLHCRAALYSSESLTVAICKHCTYHNPHVTLLIKAPPSLTTNESTFHSINWFNWIFKQKNYNCVHHHSLVFVPCFPGPIACNQCSMLHFLKILMWFWLLLQTVVSFDTKVLRINHYKY